MKKTFTLILVLLFSAVYASEPPEIREKADPSNSTSLALSVNPAGFLFFGPTLDLGLGISDKTIINMHARFTPLGLLSQTVKKEDGEKAEDFKGVGFGAGIIQFLNTGGSGMYLGGQVEFETMTTTYDIGQDWEWFEEGKNYVFVANAGYRYLLENGMFVNLGLFFGGIYTDYFWEYKDVSYGVNDLEEREGTTLFPVGSLEIAVGINIL